MNTLVEILISSVNTVFDLSDMFLSSLSDGGFLSAAGGGATLAFALGTVAQGIDEQFSNIDNLVTVVTVHQTTWPMPSNLLQQLTNNRDQLHTLINKCRTTSGSQVDRALRNSLLKSTVGLCLLEARIWAYGEFVCIAISGHDMSQYHETAPPYLFHITETGYH
ncbi:MAG: hypothetical protein LBK58_13965 [Prevotellaceae bacterium]|jgi:hypothetical protein|nr:hypothetical protein [Prevotellaceae bacterium]